MKSMTKLGRYWVNKLVALLVLGLCISISLIGCSSNESEIYEESQESETIDTYETEVEETTIEVENVQEPQLLSCYESLSSGKYKITDILVYSSLWERIHENSQVAEEIVGDICYFTGEKDENIIGGVIPIRDEEKQKFYYGTGYLVDLEVKGNYYPIFSFETGAGVSDTCFIINSYGDLLAYKRQYGIYKIELENDIAKLHVYDIDKTFEANIEKRMQEQGIQCNTYYNNVWCGNWVIDEVVYAEKKDEAEKKLGETVFMNNADYFDINFIDSNDDKVFYHMPTVEELGLEQPYYVLVWSSNSEYHAAIPISEHEMYLIADNNIFHAIQQEEYLSEYCLEGL